MYSIFQRVDASNTVSKRKLFMQFINMVSERITRPRVRDFFNTFALAGLPVVIRILSLTCTLLFMMQFNLVHIHKLTVFFSFCQLGELNMNTGLITLLLVDGLWYRNNDSLIETLKVVVLFFFRLSSVVLFCQFGELKCCLEVFSEEQLGRDGGAGWTGRVGPWLR